MADKRNRPRHLAAAVTASILLHGALLLAATFASREREVVARTPPQNWFISLAEDENATDEVRFLEPGPAAVPRAQPEANQSAPTSDSGPLAATLRDDWTSSPVAAIPSDEADATRQEGQGGLGPVTTSFFQVEARAARIVYVVDGSASMARNGAWAAACRELRSSVRRLPAGARFQVILYNDAPRALLPRFPDWILVNPALVDEACAALDRAAGQVPEGGTDHGPALKKAFLHRPDLVYILTDADDLKPEHLRLVEALNQKRAVIHTIELSAGNRDRAQMPLQVLARENRGTYQAINLGP